MNHGETRERVLREIEAMRPELVAMLAQLVQTPSVTPKYPGLDYDAHVGGETRCNAVLQPALEAAGAEIDQWEEEPGRANLVGVVRGTGDGRSLIFNGHVDTVPPGDPATWRWGDPFSGRVEAGNLYGLGSCDMKAGLVAQTKAAEALRRCGVRLRGDLILESVVGEETMDHERGVSATVRRGYVADAAIVTEPTALTYPMALSPCSAGVLQLTIDVPGKATHVMVRGSLIWPGGAGEAYGVNAIDKGVLVHQALRRLEEEWGFSKSHPLFNPGQFNIGVNVMYGRPPGPPVPFIVPHVCTLDAIVIYRPNDDSDAIKQEVETHLNRAFDLDPWLRHHRPTISWPHHWPAYDTPVDHPICQTVAAAHRDALGVEAPVFGFPAVDDASYLERGGIPAISFGPGNIMNAHAVDEHVAIDEVVAACKVYAATAMDWCELA